MNETNSVLQFMKDWEHAIKNQNNQEETLFEDLPKDIKETVLNIKQELEEHGIDPSSLVLVSTDFGEVVTSQTITLQYTSYPPKQST